MKIKLEAAYGATIGSGLTRKKLEQNGVFEENKPFGPFKIILNDDLGLHHKDLGEKIWQQHYRDYAAETRFGVLILAGKPEYFQIWANSDACLEEVKEIPSDRLYAYIEHKKEDGFETNQGFIVSVNAENYKGSATVRDGKGYLIFHNGNYYHGELKGGLRNGIGTEMFADGKKYEGKFLDDKKHGRGVFKFASGDVYDGEWEDGKKHGRGVFKYANGDVYDGEWEDDKKHGRGVYKYASGDVYSGEWEDDKQHGNAIYTFANGNKYNMVWENGKQISKIKIN